MRALSMRLDPPRSSSAANSLREVERKVHREERTKRERAREIGERDEVDARLRFIRAASGPHSYSLATFYLCRRPPIPLAPRETHSRIAGPCHATNDNNFSLLRMRKSRSSIHSQTRNFNCGSEDFTAHEINEADMKTRRRINNRCAVNRSCD